MDYNKKNLDSNGFDYLSLGFTKDEAEKLSQEHEVWRQSISRGRVLNEGVTLEDLNEEPIKHLKRKIKQHVHPNRRNRY